MGCWNETCALTQLPIHEGMPVVALTTINGLRSYQSSVQGAHCDLLFGLPYFGKYDSYGEADKLENPAYLKFQEQAFEESGYYKQLRWQREYGGSHVWHLASSPDTLWSMTEALKPVFYPECGVQLQELDSYDPVAREKSLKAYKLAEAALKELGTRLAEFEAPTTFQEAQAVLFSHFEAVFGAQNAWAAYSALKNQGLFVGKATLLMHRAAYDSTVAEFGSRKVGFYREKSRVPLRDFLAERFDEWLRCYPDEYERSSRLWSDLPSGEESTLKQRRRVYRYMSKLEDRYMAPLSMPWMAPKAPLIGHFWSGATPEQVLEVVSKDEILDFFVFQWALHYTRIDFRKGASGSQNEETVLRRKMVESVIKVLKSENRDKRDFDGTLHR